MFGVLLRKFRQGKETGPICLLIVAINAEVLFENRVQAFRLAVRLGMKGCRPICADAQEFEVGSEDRISVADEGFR